MENIKPTRIFVEIWSYYKCEDVKNVESIGVESSLTEKRDARA